MYKASSLIQSCLNKFVSGQFQTRSIHISPKLLQEWKGPKYDPQTIMWKNQPRVPRLPLPQLKDTCARYLEKVAPLLTPDEMKKTTIAVEEFLSGEGPKLQEELQRLDKESPTSWLEGFWDTMYLELRDPVIINVNPFVQLVDDPQRNTQASRAANVIAGAVDMLQRIKNNTLIPDMDKEDPYDMQQYLKLFGTARIPKWGRDVLETSMDSRHVIIMCKDNFYPLNVLRPDGSPVPEAEIQASLEHILKTAKHSPFPVSLLTTEERNQWAAHHALLSSASPENAKSLDIINKALFVLVLEHENPTNAEQMSKSLLHRDGRNRWYDKNVIVTYPNGTTGNVFEHSPVDGHTMLRLWGEIDQYSKKTKPVQPADGVDFSSLKPLEWQTNSELNNAIASATQSVSKLIDSTQTSVLKFSEFGKNGITSVKFSPDAFVQLAYYKLYGRADSTYESANTKKYLSGRTETIRSVTKESVAFTKTFSDPAATTAQKLNAMKAAAEAHIKTATDAKNGKGVDRHLFALYNIAKHKRQRLPRYTIPGIFQDPSYSKYGSNILSTSNVSAPFFDMFGFGAVHPEGLGLAYNIHPNSIQFNVTSFTGQAVKFTDKLNESLISMRKLAEDGLKSQ